MSLITKLYTKIYGLKVGEDGFGNVYYRSSNKNSSGRERRWVIYNGDSEASKVPAEWHSWLHYTTDKPMNEPKKEWQTMHEPNLTGTERAYSPDLNYHSKEAKELPEQIDYESWNPNAK